MPRFFIGLTEIVAVLDEIAGQLPVVLPLHPRTRKLLADHALTEKLSQIRITEPLSFLDMVALEQAAAVILTDSGGVQKEAFFYHVPCITMRDETEWVETVAQGWNRLTGANRGKIMEAFTELSQQNERPNFEFPYGDGNAAGKIVSIIETS